MQQIPISFFQRRLRQAFAAFAMLVLYPVAAQAQQILYAVSGASGTASTLYKLNPTTGALAATIGATGYNHMTGLAIHPTTGTMYGFVNSGPPNGSPSGFLVTIDPTTGIATRVNANNVSFHASDITFSPSGTLYAWAEPSSDDLY